MISRRRTRLGIRSLKEQRHQIETLENRIVLDSTVVFNEIMYNPVGENDAQTEWIEFFNQLNVDMDISEWVLTGAVDYEFPDGTVVPGRGHLVVAANPQALEDAGTFKGALGPWEGQLSNAGEELRLYNNDQRLMNEVDYDDTGVWPSGPDGGGVTLAKRDQFSASHVAENWTFSPQIGGTIGVDNFVREGAVRTESIVGESAPVKALVPSNGDLGMSWVEQGFDDSTWTSGQLGVGHDTRSTYIPFIGLNLDEPPNDQAPIPMMDVNGSVYMRIPFNVDNPAKFDGGMRLRARYDDGFVVFLNGVEVVSANAPGRDGEPGELSWDSIATSSHSDRRAQSFEDFDLTEHAGLLNQGENILAIQGMNQSVDNNDSLFDFQIEGDIKLVPATTLPLVFNEVAPFNAEEFFVELTNTGDEPIDLNGMSITSTDDADYEYVFGAQSIAPGEILSLSAQQLGFQPDDTERLLLRSADKLSLIDARRVTGRLRGRSEQHDGQWLYPSTATPGQPNTFNIEDDIVINEIMYHPHPELGIPDTPPEFDRTAIIEMTSEWRYNDTGAKLDSDWAQQTYNVDNVNWKQGPGLLGYETSDLGVPIGTEFTDPGDNDPGFITYYFQSDFELTEAELADIDILELTHLIDDGAIIYLNGQEVIRYNLPAGPIDADTGGERVSNAERIGPANLPVDLLKVGTNVVSAEVHNRRATDGDVVFGAELTKGVMTADLIPGTTFRERSEEEWIELYNKGDSTVDLSGWTIRDGIRFDFPAGTQLAAGEYLVISSDADYLKQKYDDINIIGSFSGSLSDHDDRILLRDANDNPADDVHYYEGGTWSSYADGGAVSLELKDPHADNSKGEVWGISDDSSESEWITHTFRGMSLEDVFGSRALSQEFLFGLLSRGEFLIDDISVTKDPGGAAIELMKNGTFEGDALGESPEFWRLIGNHSGIVVDDPTNPGNKVLHMTATGAMAHVHDHAETTFANDEDIDNGTEYEISFRAKWLVGNSQLNSRLWFNRLSNTVRLDIPDRPGTPGAQNTSFVANVGPTFSEFKHGPVTPTEAEEVTVNVQAVDPEGVTSVKLWWRKDEGEWATVDMSMNDAGSYEAVIPPHESGDVVQFYVEATDGQGATSMYPADGPDSRALYQVEDGVGPRSPVDRFRIIMLDEESDDLYRGTNRMSNWFLPFTLVHNDMAYYDIDVRLIGSRWIRPNSGYKIRMNPAQLFYGVHDSIRFDLNGLGEVVMKQMLNRAGGSKASQYDDIAYMVGPNRGHNHEILLQLARYENIYLNEQFEDGSNGTKYELDDVTVPTGGGRDGESLKSGTEVNTTRDIGGNARLLRQQGANPEFYRAHVLIKSNRAKDDFGSVVRMAQAIHTEGAELFERSNEVMDVDLWMRHYAHQSYFGNWDTYGFRRPKNLRMYARPSDGRMIPLFWDCDLCNFSEPIKTRTEPTSRLDEIRDIPHNLRIYWGHLYDFVTTSFTEEYVGKWAPHYGELANNQTHGGDENFTGIVNSTRARSAQVLRDLERDIPRVDFEITTNGGNDTQVDEPSILLEGKGWVDVREMRLAGTEQPLDVFWPEKDAWQVTIPLNTGANAIAIEAVDFQGNVVASDNINVTSTAGDPVTRSLRVTEVNYNPMNPTAREINAGFDDADEFEFIELTNIGDESISLTSVSFVRIEDNGDEQGVDFHFSEGAIFDLDPGQTVLVVENTEAFQFRYGGQLPVAGQWSGGLGNGGEMVTIENAGVLLQQFTYDDGWYPSTDGDGRTLQIVDAGNPDLNSWNIARSWRPSSELDGTPGETAPTLGDVTGDGVFSTDDLLRALQAGEYEDGVPDNSTYAEGDWDGDKDFTTSDLVFAFMHGRYVGDAQAATPAGNDRSLAVSDVQTDSTRPLNQREDGNRVRTTTATERKTAHVRLAQQSVDAVFETSDAGLNDDEYELAAADLLGGDDLL